MQHIVYYTTTILLISVGVFLWLERKMPYTKGLPLFRDGFWVDLVWYTLIQSYFLKILIFDHIIIPIDKAWHLSSTHLVASWPLVLQVLFFLVVHDFYIYWFHRWQHHSRILWRTHEAHHSNKAVDWLAGTRSHALEILINQTVEFAPIVLLGYSGGYKPIAYVLDRGGGNERLDGVLLVDALYGEFEKFENWFRQNHRDRFFVSLYTSSTQQYNLKLSQDLQEENLPLKREIPGKIQRGLAYFGHSPAEHQDVIQVGPPADPIELMLKGVYHEP